MVDFFGPLPGSGLPGSRDSKSNFDGLLVWLQNQSISFRKALTVGHLKVNKFLQLGPATELTIAGGKITVTGSYHRVDTQDDNTTDDLNTINGGSLGVILLLRSAVDARDIVLKDAVDNIRLAGGADFTLDDVGDTILLFRTNSVWLEISRSNN